MARCIERYKSSKEHWKEWQHGSTFFNSGYVDYLDENWAQQKEQEAKAGHEVPSGVAAAGAYIKREYTPEELEIINSLEGREDI